jgi:hypothetical protein
VLAGNWAEIRADATTSESGPVAGEPTEIGFTVLQHGETAAGWVTPTVRLTSATTGETLDVAAEASGPDGHFIATVTLPSAGFWSWQVDLAELETDDIPVTMSVATATGEPPVFDQATVMSAIARARSDIRAEVLAETGGTIERLSNEVGGLRTQASRLADRVDTLTEERAALEERLAAAEAQAGDAGVPVLGIVLLAVLAGAAAGFAMTWLAGRPQPQVRFSPAPRGSKPA